MPNILITGGCGFIGSHVAERFAKNNSVIIIDNLSSGKIENIAHIINHVTYHNLDICNYDDIKNVFQNIDSVVHLAANVSVQYSIKNIIKSSEINVQGFLNVLELSRKYNVKKIFYASSAAVFGDNQNMPLDESSITNPISPYGLEKKINEQYAGLYKKLYNTNILGLRFFNVYGQRQRPDSMYAGVISKFIDYNKKCKPFIINGDGMQTRDFINVEDIADVIFKLNKLTKFDIEVANIATGKKTSILDLANIINKANKKIFKQKQTGDIKNSYADISQLNRMIPNLELKPLVEAIKNL